MPIYEFFCNKCGVKFDYLVRGGGDSISCPACHGRDLKKLISGFAFHSKGNDAFPGTGQASSSCGGCSGGNCSCCSR